ncbi:hypothetical protein B0E48_12980 [Rhodanobacter sp. C03]|nr:hypothetical protein B0E48_12980 [Rhodanobacter sp. C03]
MGGCSSQDAKFSTSPAALEDCGAATLSSAVVVNWDASRTKEKGVKIWVSNAQKPSRSGIWGADQNGTLWMGGGLVGSATTGQWMRPGTNLTLTDDSGDDTLAKITIPSLPCKKSAG